MNAFDKEDRLLIGEMKKDIECNKVDDLVANLTMGKSKSQKKKDKSKHSNSFKIETKKVKKETRRGTL